MITNERLAQLQLAAESGILTAGKKGASALFGEGVSAKELIELINAYREHRAALASGLGDAFLEGMQRREQRRAEKEKGDDEE